MWRLLRNVALVATLSILAPTLLQAQSQTFDDLVRNARFIFVGDVVMLGASTMPAVIPTGNSAVVRVSDLLTGEDLFADFRGREITVELLQPARYRKTVFFSNIVVYGRSLHAVELSNQPLGDAANLRKQIAAAQQRNLDRDLSARIARAAVVISGRVVEVRRRKGGIPQSEHDPLWASAIIKTDAVLKGDASSLVEVLFPTSDDEMWDDAPKFSTGQNGVWILQRDQQEKGFPLLRRPGLTALDPLDFPAPGALSRIRQLVASTK